MKFSNVSKATNCNPGYIYGFEPLRVFAAFAVVYVHGCISNQIVSSWGVFTTFAVPRFFLIAAFLLTRTIDKHGDLIGFTKIQLNRLLVPYLAWSFIYLLLRAIKIISLEGFSSWIVALDINLLRFFLLGGYTYHLWFIPTLIYFSIIIFVILKLIKPLSIIFQIYLLIFLATISFYLYSILVEIVEPSPDFLNYLTRYFMRNIGFIFIGVATFKWLSLFYLKNTKFILFGFFTFTWIFYLYDFKTLWMVSFSLFVFYFFLFLKDFKSEIVNKISKVAFGIYLVHSFFLELIRFSMALFNFPMSVFSTLFMIFLAFSLSVVFCLKLSKYPKLEWLVR